MVSRMGWNGCVIFRSSFSDFVRLKFPADQQDITAQTHGDWMTRDYISIPFYQSSFRTCLLFSILSLFRKNKSNLMRCLCDCESRLNRTNLYETWYLYHGTWAHLNGVLHKSLPSVCICIPPSLLGNGSIKTLSRQQIHMQ
jgi:hypothetical protein